MIMESYGDSLFAWRAKFSVVSKPYSEKYVSFLSEYFVCKSHTHMDHCYRPTPQVDAILCNLLSQPLSQSALEFSLCIHCKHLPFGTGFVWTNKTLCVNFFKNPHIWTVCEAFVLKMLILDPSFIMFENIEETFQGFRSRWIDTDSRGSC